MTNKEGVSPAMTDTPDIQELREAGEDGGNLMGYFCRGHVADWKFAQAANDFSGALEAYDQRHVRPEKVRQVWWRCIPIRDEPGFHRYEPAEPHSRGAFPATVCESVSDAVQVWGQRQQNRWNSGRCRGFADGVAWCLKQLDSINPEAGEEILKRFHQDRAEIEKDPLGMTDTLSHKLRLKSISVISPETKQLLADAANALETAQREKSEVSEDLSKMSLFWEEEKARAEAAEAALAKRTKERDRYKAALTEIVRIRDEELEGMDGARLSNIARATLPPVWRPKSEADPEQPDWANKLSAGELREAADKVLRPSGEAGPELPTKPKGVKCPNNQCPLPQSVAIRCATPDCPFAQGEEKPGQARENCPNCGKESGSPTLLKGRLHYHCKSCGHRWDLPSPLLAEEDAAAIAEKTKRDQAAVERAARVDPADMQRRVGPVSRPSEAPDRCDLTDCGALYGPPYGIASCTRRDCPHAQRAKPVSPPPDRGERYTAVKEGPPERLMWFVYDWEAHAKLALCVDESAARTLARSFSEVDDLKYQQDHVDSCNRYLVSEVERLRGALDQIGESALWVRATRGETIVAVREMARAALQETDSHG